MKNRNRMEIISYRLPTVETWNCFASWKERQDHPFPIWFRDVGVRQTMMNLPMKAMDHHLLFCAKKRPATGHLVPIDHQSSNRPCYYLTSYHSGFHLLNQSIELNWRHGWLIIAAALVVKLLPFFSVTGTSLCDKDLPRGLRRKLPLLRSSLPPPFPPPPPPPVVVVDDADDPSWRWSSSSRLSLTRRRRIELAAGSLTFSFVSFISQSQLSFFGRRLKGFHALKSVSRTNQLTTKPLMSSVKEKKEEERK